MCAVSSSPEILPYRLDITDVEAKAARMQDLLGKIASGRATGQDTSELEKQLLREMEAMSKSTGKTKEADSAIKQLVSQKEKLSSVVSLLGGQFGGIIGQLGNIVELFFVFGKAAVLPATAIASVTAMAVGYNQLADSIKRVIEERDKLAEREKSEVEKGIGLQAQVTKERAAIGIFDDGLKATQDIISLGRQGFDRDLAKMAVNASSLLGGLSPEDQRAVMAGFLAGGKRASFSGDRAADEEVARAMLARGRRGDAQQALRAYHAGTSNAAIIESLNIDLGGGNREAELQRMQDDLNLSPENMRVFRREQFPTERQPKGGFSVGVAFRRFLREWFEPKGSEAVNQALDERGAEFRSMDRATHTAPVQINIQEGPRIQTQINGAGHAYADSTYSVASNSPGSTNGARAITP